MDRQQPSRVWAELSSRLSVRPSSAPGPYCLLVLLALSIPSAAQDRIELSLQARRQVFTNTWNVVNERFFDATFNGVDWREAKDRYQPLAESAQNRFQLVRVLQAMLDELHVSHTEIHSGAYYTTGLSSLRGPVQNPVLVEGQWVMRPPDEGSAAERAGVQRGWILKHWNGRPYGPDVNTGCSQDEIVTVRFQDLAGDERTVDIGCQLVDWVARAPSMTSRTFENGLRYIRFSNFRREVTTWLSDEIRANASASGLIIDLRRNGGGDIDVVRDCLSLLFETPRVIGEFRERKGKRSVLKVSGRGAKAYRGRVFVLIDEASGSGSEVFAAAVQESRRGVVVGRVSGGAVLLAKGYNLPHGFSLEVAQADYRTAEGARLEGHGVVPDEPVTVTMLDFLEDRDPDLDRVRELWKKR